MSENTLKARLKHPYKTEAEWKAADPVLYKGEMAYSSDKKQWKTGNGTSKWSALSYDKAEPTSHSHTNLDTIGSAAYYGSDAANSLGWYKVYSATLTGYGDHVARLSLISGYSTIANGVINLHLRCDNGSTLLIKRLSWETRQGFNAGDVILNTNGNTWTLYVKQSNSQYGRIKVRVLESLGTGTNWTMALSTNTTKESSAPTATATATDGATVNYANSAGSANSVAWDKISGKPTSFTPASHTHDDRYYTESEMNTKLSNKAESIVLATNADLNNVTTPGIYSCGGGNTIKNKPSGLDAIGLIVVHNASGAYYTQILTSSINNATYRRTCLNGTWGTWTQDKYTDTNTTYSNATASASGLMSANDYIDLQSVLEEIKALKKTKDYDGGKASATSFEDDLNGGGAGAVYTLEQTDFTATLKTASWTQSGTVYKQTVINNNVSGINDYLIAPNPSSSEDQTAYNTNFEYITIGSSSGHTITVQALKKPTIDLSVKFIKI